MSREGVLSPLHAFLAGKGSDGRGRNIRDVLAFTDDQLEHVHDFVQWLFPLPVPSRAQPHSPILEGTDLEDIRQDPDAIANLRLAADLMLGFYGRTGAWLQWQDHNHLRISRILQSLRLLLGRAEAHHFYDRIDVMNRAAGSPVNPLSVQFWRRALDD
jgi:hypothetical protein